MKKVFILLFLVVTLFLSGCADMATAFGETSVENSAQICDPTSQADWQHAGLVTTQGEGRYYAWLQCNPPSIDSSHIPNNCQMISENRDPSGHAQNPALLAWKTSPKYSPGGDGRLPYDYYTPTIANRAWDGDPSQIDSSDYNIPRITKFIGTQLLLCQVRGQYTFQALYWESNHVNGRNLDVWRIVQMKATGWGNLWRVWYGSAALPNLNGGTGYYCITAQQSRDAEDARTQMTVWATSINPVNLNGDVHAPKGCSVNRNGLLES